MIGCFFLAFQGQWVALCLLAGLSKISSSSPTPKLNYRERRLITDRRSKGGGRQVDSKLSIFPFCSMKLHFIHSDFWQCVFPGADSGAALSLLSILFFTIIGTTAGPRSAAQEAALLCCLEKGQAMSVKRLSIILLLFWFHNLVCIYCVSV